MNPTAAHVAPFVAWLALMHFLDLPQLPPAWAYAIRSVLCLAVFLVCRPWRWYERPNWKALPLAAGVGVGVLVAWVALEGPWMDALPAVRDFYVKWGILPLGEWREPLPKRPLRPEVCGWPLAIVRVLGSGLVIGMIEEFFWRGFLYRWLLGLDFTQVPPGKFAWIPFLITAGVFAAGASGMAGRPDGRSGLWLALRAHARPVERGAGPRADQSAAGDLRAEIRAVHLLVRGLFDRINRMHRIR
jgi:membrane protease YdiL (CAAX protease family)